MAELRRSKRLSGKSPEEEAKQPAGGEQNGAAPKAECPFPFIFLHAPGRGLQLHWGKLIVLSCIAVFFLYYKYGHAPTIS